MWHDSSYATIVIVLRYLPMCLDLNAYVPNSLMRKLEEKKI